MAYKTLDMAKIKRMIEKKQETILRNSMKMATAPKYVQIGWTEKSGKYPDTGMKVVDVARIHEFGIPGVHSEKAFVRGTQEENEKKWIKLFEKDVKKQMKASGGQLSNAQKNMILYNIGEVVRNDLRSTITEIDLVDTTRLKNSILITLRRR